MSRVLVFGLGVTGRAVVDACLARGVRVIAADDRPGPSVVAFAVERSIELAAEPTLGVLIDLVGRVDVVIPAPGLPDAHPIFSVAAERGVTVADETDLAQHWDTRPCVAITGTNGKTTVTTLVTDMLIASGIPAAAVGNTDVPLVAAIDDPAIATFVVESSSFRLNHSCRFAPRVATWLNFAPDHLDIHLDLATYEAAKAVIWSRLGSEDIAIANADDQVVMRNVSSRANVVTFGAREGADWRVEHGMIVGPDGALMTTAALARSLPHDVANSLAAAATASAAGASLAAIARVLAEPRALPHRVAFVAEAMGVSWYDDSKATVPQATAAAVSGFDSVVLIAGGRNKGLDLSPLGDLSDRVRAVVAIGDSADDVMAAFAGRRPVVRAGSMRQAVDAAARLARPGDVVLLSPACASFDWYANYAERGDDFSRLVRELADRAGGYAGEEGTSA